MTPSQEYAEKASQEYAEKLAEDPSFLHDDEPEESNAAGKAAMKAADKSGARYVIVIGEEELNSKSVELKNMNSGVSVSVTIDSLVNAL